jgi:hypothetical protein
MTDRKSFVQTAAERGQADIEAELARYREEMLSTFVQAIGRTSKETEALMETLSATVRRTTRDMERMTEVASQTATQAQQGLRVVETNVARLTDSTQWTHMAGLITDTIDRWSKPHWALAVLLMILTGILGVQIGTWTSLKWVEAEVMQANESFDSVIMQETIYRRDKQGRLMVRFRNDIDQPLVKEGWVYTQEPKRKKGKR